MRTIDARRLLATISVAAMIGGLAGLWSANASTASLPAASTCGACTSQIWLWLPAMRRGGR